MVHNLVPYDLIREDYQDGWIQAAVERGVTEAMIQSLVAMIED